ncbi:MAG TPA: enediyne biosynthesis protein UnbU [Vicinamibacteria bacterium]|nr:enediyne biosynthesis protein UnbU [Vicinamibacteria bacterium]
MTAPAAPRDLRLPALRRFATAITIVNILGHTILGLEPSWAQMFTSLFTAYGLELFLEWVQSRVEGRRPRYRGSFVELVNFLLPAHITGLAIGMLMYANDRLLPFAFTAAAGIASKALLTAPVKGGRRHFMNPSNAGLAAAFLLLPQSVAIASPYQFTSDLSGYGDWLLPLIVVCTGSFLNTFFTRRIPLVLSWLGGFALQATLRHLLDGAALLPAFAPMTSMAFLLFTFYMVPDPGTTPSVPARQVAFGASVGLLYGVLVRMHLTFAMFYALCIVCAVRGIALNVAHRRAEKSRSAVLATAVAAAAPAHDGVAVPVPAPSAAQRADAV